MAEPMRKLQIILVLLVEMILRIHLQVQLLQRNKIKISNSWSGVPLAIVWSHRWWGIYGNTTDLASSMV